MEKVLNSLTLKSTMAHIKIERFKYTQQTTIGKLYLDDTYHCYTLEDTLRPAAIKVKGHTAIPQGVYSFEVTYSPRFKREMILIYNQNDKSLDSNGISFSGLRIHGGNRHEHSEGCPLTAYNYNPDDDNDGIEETTIQGTAEKAITKWANEHGGCGTIEFVNLPQL